MPRIGYLVHDLSDSAVERRVAAFRKGGAEVSVAGFVRGDAEVRPIRGIDPLPLGRTHDARLFARLPRVVGVVGFWMDRIQRHMGPVDAVVVRNLEMLPIALQLVNRMTPRPRLVYECLDIHRLLTDRGPVGVALRWGEQRLGRSVDLVITSSPAFIEHHFATLGPPVALIENKVLLTDGTPSRADATPPGPPWRIGWFGALRCRRSFDLLSALAERSNGRIEVVIRGRPSPAIFENLEAEAKGRPNVRFEGAYKYPDDLAAIYGEVHFAWCIDFYEEGKNSTWLLPNRLYEGCHHRTLPIALSSVETGRFLSRLGLGVLLDDASPDALDRLAGSFSPGLYADGMARLEKAAPEFWRMDEAECAALVRAVTLGDGHGAGRNAA